jgi:hypothetical protein
MLHSITVREVTHEKFKYFVSCNCFWEGRTSNLIEAREWATNHKQKRTVGIDKAEITDETKESKAVAQAAGGKEKDSVLKAPPAPANRK